LIVSPNGDFLVCGLNNSQITIVNLSLLNSVSTTDKDTTIFELVSKGFHQGGINGLSVACRKPLIASCGVDGWVRFLEFVCFIFF
jgi:hypothetical protein